MRRHCWNPEGFYRERKYLIFTKMYIRKHMQKTKAVEPSHGPESKAV